jgi:hypothetical protein
MPLLNLSSVVQTDSVERDQQSLSLSGAHGFNFTVHPHEIVTVRIVGTMTTGAPDSRGAEKADRTALSDGDMSRTTVSTARADVPAVSRSAEISDDSQTARGNSYLEASPIHPSKDETFKLLKLDSQTSK